MSSRRPWLEVELQILQQHVPDHGPVRAWQELTAAGHNRTQGAVKTQANAMGLRASESRLTAVRHAQAVRARENAQAMWDTMPDEERVRRQALKREHDEQFWTAEQRQNHGRVMAEVMTRRWAATPETERADFRAKCRAAWENLPDEAKIRHALHTLRRNKAYWSALAPTERQALTMAIGAGQRARWARLSPEQRAHLRDVASCAMQKVWREASPELQERMLEAAHRNSRAAQAHNNLKSPNKAEQIVAQFGIPGLEMTLTDPTRRVLLAHPDGRKWRKNPDFAFHWQGPENDGQPRLVVEIMGFGVWHSLDEVDHLIQEYAGRGVRCLVFGAKEVHQNPSRVKTTIEREIAALG